jgi:hypothetical protein
MLETQNSTMHSMRHSCIHQIAAAHDELGEMYDSDEDVIPCDDDGNHLATTEFKRMKPPPITLTSQHLMNHQSLQKEVIL